jgi:ADP-heptose:LPS heptosyltransferase
MDRLKPLEHKFKAIFFALFKFLLKKGSREFNPIDGNAITRVLFLRPEKLGDMIISFPVFDGLKDRFPQLKIGILASPRSHAIIKDDPRFERIFLYRKNVWRDLKSIFAIRKERYDCVVDMICDDSVTALFLSQLTAPGKHRIGVGKAKYREFYDFNYDHRRGNTGHIIENTLKLLEAFGIDSESVSGYATPYVTQPALTKTKRFLDDIRAGNSVRLVGYNMSAGAPTRIWAMEKSIGLVKRIVGATKNSHVVIITTPDERRRGEELIASIGRSVSLLPPGLSLMEVSALISGLDLLISPDTSLVHIARAFRVPVVGLYSRFMKNFLLWRPFDQEVGAVVANDDNNIFDITVDQVFDTLCRVIDSTEVARR